VTSIEQRPKLGDFGISKMQASRWQRASRAVNSMIRRRDVGAPRKIQPTIRAADQMLPALLHLPQKQTAPQP
jgi:hypothetical protein